MRQRPLWARALYFFLVGWWFSALWLVLARVAAVTILGLPLGFWMFDRTPAVVSLYRQYATEDERRVV